MSQPDPQPPARYRWTFISVALFVIGLLIIIPAGLCTAVMGAFMFAESPDASGLMLLLMFGGIPMAAGAVLIWAGLKARPRE